MAGPLVGRRAPEFHLTTLDGQDASLDAYKGQVLLLDFWATWCGPCKEQLPDLKAVYAAAKDNPRSAILGVAVDDDPEKGVKAFTAQNDMPWPQALIKFDSPTAKAYAVHGVPTLLLVAPDGTVAAKFLTGPAVRSAVLKSINSTP